MLIAATRAMAAAAAMSPAKAGLLVQRRRRLPRGTIVVSTGSRGSAAWSLSATSPGIDSSGRAESSARAVRTCARRRLHSSQVATCARRLPSSSMPSSSSAAASRSRWLSDAVTGRPCGSRVGLLSRLIGLDGQVGGRVPARWPEVAEENGQPAAGPRTSALHRALGDLEDGRRLGDRKALDVDQHDGRGLSIGS